jgi:guanosine-3',5'-bis(diphosphate) 3'-pyrophosphohydrolase
LLSKAIILAAEAHDGQFDKGGRPYILHPLRIAEKFHPVQYKIVALLHDILEDTKITTDDLSSIGCSPEMIEAIQCLTRSENETYMDFIRRCKENPIAKLVKMADLEDNMDLGRIANPNEQDRKRNERYQKAKHLLLYD